MNVCTAKIAYESPIIKLNINTFPSSSSGIFVRSGGKIVNHLYVPFKQFFTFSTSTSISNELTLKSFVHDYLIVNIFTSGIVSNIRNNGRVYFYDKPIFIDKTYIIPEGIRLTNAFTNLSTRGASEISSDDSYITYLAVVDVNDKL